ncbi:ABC transporter substrate-binding protein [Pontibacillus halophilus JSM 076056 = DSM 19796]|uniref:ABC transporter substrate-binding protein n=1 Tax=Pontibacillus halophilus JSM 076056 = DSM 19796 TaxID=1385510 RepID=A0A0A5GHU2_9BACI|nr:ABC transporter substrate-binding protein [Pontibacillus halophilus]KGX91554.1 ABC transporter substrate-binding protein [Pontibacillus halophilus JSM 076056 = DSM 19796]
MEKRRGWMMAILISLLAVAGCSSSETSKDEDEVTLVYARGVDTTVGNEKLIEAFEKEHPNIHIEFREMPSDSGQQHDQYVTTFSGKSSEIDVFDADVVWPAEFAQAGYVMGLDRFIEEEDIDMSKYFEGTVESVTYSGRTWAMPKFTDAGLLYYRTDLVDNPPETWDELSDMASDLNGQEGTKFGYVMQANQYEGIVVNAVEFIHAYGGQVLDENGQVVVDSEEAIAGIQKMAEIAQSNYVPNNILNFTELETETAFIQGNTVFARNWPYMQSSSADEERSKVVGDVGFSLLPSGDAQSASTLGGWVTMINKYTEHPEEAWEFVKFMTGMEGQKISAIEGGVAPTIESLYEDESVKEASPVFANEAFVETLQNAVPRPVSPNYPKITDIIQIEVSKALAGDQTPEQAVRAMQQEIEAVVNDS